MLHIKSLDEGLEVFKALGSDVRMRIVELLSERGEMNMNEIAAALELTNGALTGHIRRLEECGIIKTVSEGTGHGNQKLCSMRINQILLSAGKVEEKKESKVYETELRVGHYSDYQVTPPCGLASVYNMIGNGSDTKYFSHPDRLQAGILWFSRGYVEYRIPNLLPDRHQISQITLYFEISPETATGLEESLTEVAFYLNGRRLGTWLAPEDFRWSRGLYTPVWWNRKEKQSGLLKMVVINESGTFLDGLKISDFRPGEFKMDSSSEIRFRFAVENKAYRGGMVLYGSGFGSYNQDIRVRVHYTEQAEQVRTI